MAEINAHEKDTRFKLGALAFPGLRTSDGRILEEMKRDLLFPYSIRTYKEMSYDPSISSALTIIKDVIRGVDWEVKPGSNPERAEFIKQCMDDMEDSWDSYINEALSMLEFGFSVQEKVFKFRNGRRGKYKSKYDDGLIGWAKLPSRSQDTLDKWLWKDEGRQLWGVRQNLSLVPGDPSKRFGKFQYISMPRSKFLLFTHDKQRGNPEGKSPLRSCYVPWKYKIEIENYEAIGVSRQFVGMPVISLPPDFLSEDADEDKQAVVNWARQTIENFNNNEQAGIVMPRSVDPDTKQDMFDFRLESVSAGAMHDTNKIVDRYESKILMSFLADVLKMGQSNVGSFALADAKTNLLAIRIAAILKQITTVINNDLIPHTFRLNGWDDEQLPYVKHGDLEELSLEDLGKYIQRVVSVGAMEVDKDVSDHLRNRIRVEDEPTRPLDDRFKPDGESRAGDGQRTSGPGTSTSANGQDDDSVSNSENT